jgi:hypothetical protein
MEAKSLTIGSIVFWALIRLAFTIVGLWILFYYIDYGTWWMLGIVSLYVVVIHPAIIQFDMFKEQAKPVMNSTLCSSCKYFDASAILCTSLDEHPTENYLPCKGELWEPKNYENEI